MKNTRKTPASYIKDALKVAFPWVKFSCKYKSFAGGDDVNISWTWWPSQKDVEKIADQFQMWDFDWMIDMYEYRETDKPAEQLAKYVFCERKPAEREDEEIIEEIRQKTGLNWGQYIEMIKWEENSTRAKYDHLKMWCKQFLQEAWYSYDEASDKAWIVYELAYKKGLFAF